LKNQLRTPEHMKGHSGMQWDYITHRIRQVHRSRYVIEQPDRHGEWEPVGWASTVERAEKIVAVLKTPKRKNRAPVDDTAWQDNLPRGNLSSEWLMPRSPN
jgi:hypothetical protein